MENNIRYAALLATQISEPALRSKTVTTTRVQYLPMGFIVYLSMILIFQMSCIDCGNPLTGFTEYTTNNRTAGSYNKIRSSVVTENTSAKAQATITQKLPKLAKRSGNPSDAKLKKTIHINEKNPQNRSREPFAPEGSEHESVIYLSDADDYIPVTSLRGNHPHLAQVTTEETGSNVYLGAVNLESWQSDAWEHDYNKRLRLNATKVQHIEAECQDDFMKIRIGFNGSFAGLLYSAGYAYDPDCVYVNGSGRDYYEFYIQLNRCGTLGKNGLEEEIRKSTTKNFMWNTITVQYNPLIEEEFDEHFKVTCEYGYDFWKTVTFPFLDVEVATGNPVVFTLSPPECYMEIRNGYGMSGNRVTDPVRVGDPLTLIIYMRSKYDGFDLVVNDCYAHNGANKRIQLIDEFGCPEDEKLISRFRGSWSEPGIYEIQVYAYLKTFRFTGSPALYIECDVRMCHGRCPTQRCHWRNLKNVVKRAIKNETTVEFSTKKNDDVPLSENVNLFKALRVLQEEEEDDDVAESIEGLGQSVPLETCIRTSMLSALTTGLSIIVFTLFISLMITCTKLHYRKTEHHYYDAYINHKGQID